MKRAFYWIAGLAVIIGCGGGTVGTQKGFGVVTGNITDSDGGVVRGARVFYRDKSQEYSTYSNSSGAYTLAKVPVGDTVIQAEATQDGVRFVGGNYVEVFEQERSKSVNIAVVPVTEVAVMFGQVTDSGNNPIQDARVFANGGALSSSIALTDKDGKYRLGSLEGGRTYDISASGRGFNAALSQTTLSPGETRQIDFVLGGASSPTLPAPANLTATVWTSPREATRSTDVASAVENLKRLHDPTRANRKAVSRSSDLGNPIEVDLAWDPMPGPNLLGFGIYRGTSPTGPTAAIDFLRDPETGFFADQAEVLRERTNYYYEITALNTRYPDTANSESDFSDRYGVRPIGDLLLDRYERSSNTLRWFAANEAEAYVVYVFDRYPSVGVGSVWNTEGSPTTGTIASYNGPAAPGKRYYWMVLGLANNDDSLTISPVGDFVPN